MNKHFALLLLTALGLIISCTPKKTVNYNITQEELKNHIDFLASDSLKGRKAGSVEGKIAAEYVKVQFQNYGLTLLGEGGFEYFDIATDLKFGDSNSLVFNDIEYELDKDFKPWLYSANTEFSGSIAFAGYGLNISSDEFKWNDFENLDIKDKWVIVLRGASNQRLTRYAEDKTKVLTVEDLGGKGVLFVSPETFDSTDAMPELKFQRSNTTAGIPVIQISRTLANEILKTNKTDLTKLVDKLNHSRKPLTFQISTELKARVNIETIYSKTQNVIAKIEGSDSILRNEYIVIGAHYDHLGMGGEGSNSRSLDTLAPHNGADDNASGVAGIIELAGKMQSMKDSIKRSIIFISFAAEEIGILGSKYFVNNDLIDLTKVKAMINFDMIGRLDSTSNAIIVGGVGTSIEGLGILEPLAENYGLNLKTSSEGYGPSDHAAFYTKNIPVFFITTGAHDDYHTINDDAEKINLIGEEKVVNFGLDIVLDLANRKESLTYQEAGPKERKSEGNAYNSSVKFGIMPDFTDSKEGGMGVDAVTDPEGPAAKGGMLKGDVIVAIDGKSVKGIGDYMARIKNLTPGQTTSVDVIRDGEKVVLILQL